MSKTYNLNYGTFTLIITLIGFTIFATALPRNPEIMLGYLVLIPFLIVAIFVVLIDIRNVSLKQLRYWEIMLDDIHKQQEKEKVKKK